MKKIILTSLFIILSFYTYSFVIIPTNHVTINSHEGIVVLETKVNQDQSLTIKFKNTNSNNYDRTGEIRTYTFEWYLSYKGKRISDYYSDALECGKSTSHTVFFWPDEVPVGYEKYITVQFGRELKSIKKDRRDDY